MFNHIRGKQVRNELLRKLLSLAERYDRDLVCTDLAVSYKQYFKCWGIYVSEMSNLFDINVRISFNVNGDVLQFGYLPFLFIIRS